MCHLCGTRWLTRWLETASVCGCITSEMNVLMFVGLKSAPFNFYISEEGSNKSEMVRWWHLMTLDTRNNQSSVSPPWVLLSCLSAVIINVWLCRGGLRFWIPAHEPAQLRCKQGSAVNRHLLPLFIASVISLSIKYLLYWPLPEVINNLCNGIFYNIHFYWLKA